MQRELHISDVRFTRATEAHQRTGVVGWARCTLDDWLRLDGLIIRHKADGKLAVFFPEHVGRTERRFALIWPLRAEDRACFETHLLLEIQGLLESAP